MTAVDQRRDGAVPAAGASDTTVLLATPTCDVYGSDLQLLETVAGLRDAGHPVVVAASADGPLRPRLDRLGAEVRILRTPVLRRGDATAAGLARLALGTAPALRAQRRLIRECGAALVCANTMTVPWWLVAARSCGVPAVCHLHEAEAQDATAVRRALAAPLRFADLLIVNSRTTRDTLCEVAPGLRPRTRLVYNGVVPPPTKPRPAVRRGPLRVLVVGRLSARKAPDVALDAVGLLRRAGRDVVIDVCGTCGPGQEAYAAALRDRAQRPDLAGAVTFSGYAAPIWPALAAADVVVAPSLGESFGNAVVEAQLALRPVVATAVQGHLETVQHGLTGLLVPPRDPAALAAALTRLEEEAGLAGRLARAGRERALRHFTADRYRREIAEVLGGLVR
jgi:glycosyltransferase involved in cell wall biosynthesis